MNWFGRQLVNILCIVGVVVGLSLILAAMGYGQIFLWLVFLPQALLQK